MLVPAPPVPGTTVVGPLVTPTDYTAVTGGTCVQADLDEAIVLIEQHLTRTLAYGNYKERLYVNRQGYAYPTATPLDPAAATNPASSSVQGDGIWIGYFTPLPDLPVFSGVVPPQADVTYFGGYQPYGNNTGPTPALPPLLRRCICKVAWFTLNPAQLAGLPGGSKSSSIAGVSVSGELSSMVISDPQLRRDLRGYRRPEVRAW